MYKDTKKIIKRILEIISEIESYEFYKKKLTGSAEKLYEDYQEGKYSYNEYKNLLDSLLKGKSKKEWVEYYNSYTYSLLKNIEPLLSQVMYSIYHDRSAENLSISGKASKKEKAEGKSEEKAKGEAAGETAEASAAPAEKASEKEPEEPETETLGKEQPGRGRGGRKQDDEDYSFVEIKRPSIISRLKSSLKPGAEIKLDSIDEQKPEEEESAIQGMKKYGRKLTDEELEKRKKFLREFVESLVSPHEEKSRSRRGKENKVWKARKKLLSERISERFFLKDVERSKKSIERKLKRAGKPSLLSRIREKLGLERIRPEKARPVTVSEKDFSSAKPGEKKDKTVQEERKKAGDEKVPWHLKAKSPFSRLLEKISRVSSGIRKAAKGVRKRKPGKHEHKEQKQEKKQKEYAAASPPPQKSFLETLKSAVKSGEKSGEKEPKIELKPEEDKALRKMIDHVDSINKDISSLKAGDSGEPLSIKLKLLMIRLHYFMRGIGERKESLKEKKRQTAAQKKEALAAKKKEKLKEKEEREREKEAVPAPAPKRGNFFSVIRTAAGSAARKASGIPSSILKKVKKPAEGAEKVLSETPKPAKEKAAEEAEPEAPVAKAEEKKRQTEVPEPFKKPGVRIASSIIAPIKAWYRRLSEEERKFVADKTEIPSAMQASALRKKIVPEFEEEKVSKTMLTEEVEKIKGIMKEKKRFQIYQPSYFGSVANTLLRRITFYLIDRFPSLFKKLYDSLRLANMPILSNTYVNIMMLSTIIAFGASFVLFSLFFLIVENPLFVIVPKAFMMAVIMTAIVFILFYMYPSIKARSRERSINTNIPFAINHISAVAGSGVPPTRMFKLLVESEEYGEVAVELGKVVEYVELFGYDLLTAIRSVSLTVPSETLKEFLEGMVSSIESGSDIKNYLKEKASEAMSSYDLERQKYMETISTYSDVYTGILIAAPLFFIVALSLVSMLGGNIGGMDINVLIVLGAYVVIPLLNIIFLIFISMTQPEV